MIELNHKGIRLLARDETSDEKTFDEVVVNNAYERKDFKILKGEHWIDLGGNVGAFTLKAISKGATVDVYEPDPFNCRMIEKNLKLNGFDANIIQKAVVSNNMKEMVMFVGNNKQVWRNSLYKNWGNEKFKVPCIHFSEVFKNTTDCCKMDIEGAEMTILENMDILPKKMVFEWSFDIDRSLNRYRAVIDKLTPHYNFYFEDKRLYNLPDDFFPRNFIKAATNVFCYEKN